MNEEKQYDFLNNLEPHQKDWAVEQIKMFKELKCAIPYGLIQEQAKEITKEDLINPEEN